MQEIDRDSREYVGAEVSATVQGQPYNPTNDLVEFAFTSGSARPTDWYPGGWESTEPSTAISSYRAQILIGPGSPGPSLEPGRYMTWLRITDSPEQPVVQIGWLAIT
ncbi:hypothetical protein ACFYOF_16995 [Streptomyces sp. NPDC007148]|uniref:hypothetical protein n=1 Tax=Streptomyces sp. NPDC007148 TaxID=3364775 RepID=UPI00368D4B79